MDNRTADDLMEDVRIGIAHLTSPWTLEQLASAVGVAAEDVRPYVERFVEGGTIQPLGEDPGADHPKPMLYGPRPFEERPN
jgi:hypothetical protein